MCHHCTNRGHWEVSFISIVFTRRICFIGWINYSVKECEVLIFNLQIASWHLFVQPVSLSLTFSLQDSIEQWFYLPKKLASILRCHETMSEEGVQKFCTDDISLPRFGKYFSLFEANFLHGTTNQKHNLDRW